MVLEFGVKSTNLTFSSRKRYFCLSLLLKPLEDGGDAHDGSAWQHRGKQIQNSRAARSVTARKVSYTSRALNPEKLMLIIAPSVNVETLSSNRVPQLASLRARHLIISEDWEGGLRLITASPASPVWAASCWRITLWSQTAPSANINTFRGSFLITGYCLKCFLKNQSKVTFSA